MLTAAQLKALNDRELAEKISRAQIEIAKLRVMISECVVEQERRGQINAH